VPHQAEAHGRVARIARVVVTANALPAVAPAPRKRRLGSASGPHGQPHRGCRRPSMTKFFDATCEAIVRASPVLRAASAPVLDVVRDAAADPVFVAVERAAVGREPVGRQIGPLPQAAAGGRGTLGEKPVERRIPGVRPQRRPRRRAGRRHQCRARRDSQEDLNPVHLSSPSHGDFLRRSNVLTQRFRRETCDS
jgi:hypothetical protein